MRTGLGRAALDWLYPPSCLICGEDAEAQGGLCAPCWREMRWIDGAACRVCAAPLGFDGPGPEICGRCAEEPPEWRRGAAVCLYDGAGRSLTLALKHGDRLDAAPAMGAWMARAGAALLLDAPLVTPTPLHWTRRLGRRFNQSLELARATARASGAELAPDLLRRMRRTPSQGGLDAAGRRDNVRGAFALAPGASERIAGRRIVLIDDVMTTGSTLAACSSVLKEAGAAQIDMLVFARAARDPFNDPLVSAAASPISDRRTGVHAQRDNAPENEADDEAG